MANSKYPVNEMYILKLVDTYLRLSPNNVLSKNVFYKIMDEGVHGTNGEQIMDGYHYLASHYNNDEDKIINLKKKKKRYFYREAYTFSWNLLRKLITERFWDVLRNEVIVSLEHPDQIASKNNTTTYSYKDRNFTIYNIEYLRDKLVKEPSKEPSNNDDSSERELSGRKAKFKSAEESLRIRIQKDVEKAKINPDKGETLIKTMKTAISTMKDDAKSRLWEAVSIILKYIDEHPTNWQEEALSSLQQIKNNNKAFEDEIFYADFLWVYADILVTYDIYEGARELFEQALKIYENELRFNCTLDEYTHYITIYDSIAELTACFVDWETCLYFSEKGLSAMGNRYAESERTLLLWLGLTNRKTLSLLYTERAKESVELAAKSLEYVKSLYNNSKYDSDWRVMRLMYSYWLLGLCTLCKAYTSNDYSDWREAWKIIDEGVSFIENLPLKNDDDYQRRYIKLLMLKIDVYNIIPSKIYPSLTKEDWDKIHSFSREDKCKKTLDLVKKLEDFNFDGTPNLDKVDFLGEITSAMVDRMVLKSLMSNDEVKQFVEADNYIVNSLELYADIYFPVYGRKLAHYYAKSTEYFIELFQTRYYLQMFQKNLFNAFRFVMNYVERATDALSVAQMTEDDDFISQIQESVNGSLGELLEIFNEFNLHVFISPGLELDIALWVFLLDSCKWRIYDEDMNKVSDDEIRMIQKDVNLILDSARKEIRQAFPVDSQEYKGWEEVLNMSEAYFHDI